jgi:hypothetical protein
MHTCCEIPSKVLSALWRHDDNPHLALCWKSLKQLRPSSVTKTSLFIFYLPMIFSMVFLSPSWRIPAVVESGWNVMAHGDAREGKWRGKWRTAWVASTLHTTSEHGVSRVITADSMRTPRLPVVDWTDALADLNGLVRFAESRNLVSARVPSHFKRSLPGSNHDRFLPDPYQIILH